MANLLNLKWVRFTTVRHASEHTQGTAPVEHRTHTRARAGNAQADGTTEADNSITAGTGITATALRLKAWQRATYKFSYRHERL